VVDEGPPLICGRNYTPILIHRLHCIYIISSNCELWW